MYSILYFPTKIFFLIIKLKKWFLEKYIAIIQMSTISYLQIRLQDLICMCRKLLVSVSCRTTYKKFGNDKSLWNTKNRRCWVQRVIKQFQHLRRWGFLWFFLFLNVSSLVSLTSFSDCFNICFFPSYMDRYCYYFLMLTRTSLGQIR